MAKLIKKKKIAVALSGGVDSSVAAALLKKQRHDVIGIFMHFWHEKLNYENVRCPIENKCCSLGAEEKARQVARVLNIPFYVFHFEKEFKEYVVNYFLSEYDKGFTPNPCIACNKTIKFNFLFEQVNSIGYKYLATGHYLRIRKINNEYRLYKAKDHEKDQSYFLYNIQKRILKNLLFPLGNYYKNDVRKLAQKYNLPTAARHDSQGICFVPDKNINDFLKRNLKKYKPGEIIDTQGQQVGRHEGLQFYTIGQRKGIKVAAKKPYYVIDLDYKNNTLIVSNDSQDKKLYSRFIEFTNTNWLWSNKKFPVTINAAIRYRHKPAKALLSKISKDNYKLTFNKPQRAIMPGQSVVLYDKSQLLGGGVIRKKY